MEEILARGCLCRTCGLVGIIEGPHLLLLLWMYVRRKEIISGLVYGVRKIGAFYRSCKRGSVCKQSRV